MSTKVDAERRTAQAGAVAWQLLRPAALALPLLVLASLACLFILQFRNDYTGHDSFDFMAKNLFLAWLPLVFASLAAASYALGRPLRYVTIATFAAAWLLFLPNAPYMVTDLMHLHHRSSNFHYWLDASMLGSFAVTGVLLGLVSLRLMHNLVSVLLGAGVAWLFVLGAIGLSAVGVYLGRFLRWNSWDAVLQPEALAHDLWRGLSDPLNYRFALAFTLLVAAFLVGAYLLLVGLGQLSRRVAARE